IAGGEDRRELPMGVPVAARSEDRAHRVVDALLVPRALADAQVGEEPVGVPAPVDAVARRGVVEAAVAAARLAPARAPCPARGGARRAAGPGRSRARRPPPSAGRRARAPPARGSRRAPPSSRGTARRGWGTRGGTSRG